ncbi:hypothetical protein CABS01_16393 [Colletotrichum abscissum]|uniref:uncharacterized protein n=1 Tax=Colletotrichum abscissum TaxID=1671311 RepID=UPI0027D61B3B|nr:uncharacterized protein CABS01_16393 [Colletotrichum abscissum]KAK1471307.1 hypothetical protein CABS01_16393 [Colletotrichum abscissum]
MRHVLCLSIYVNEDQNDGSLAALNNNFNQVPELLADHGEPQRSRPKALGGGYLTTAAYPVRLSLGKVLANETCSPLSLYDFYIYLKYIELSPENLEFYVWFRNYESAYAKIGSLNNFPVAEKESDASSSRDSAIDSAMDSIEHKLPSLTMPGLKCDPEAANEIMTNIVQLIAHEGACRPNSKVGLNGRGCIKSWANAYTKPICLNNVANVVPVHIAPNSAYQVEHNAVIKTFLLTGSEKELNIPPALRDQAVLDLQHFSDPAHLRPIAQHVYGLLKNCSHRNFVRLSVSNGTFETLCMATSMGIVLTVAGFLWSGLMKFVSRMMIFDRKIRVKDVHLRRLQHKIVTQAMVGGAIFASLCSLLFVMLPLWSQKSLA